MPKSFDVTIRVREAGLTAAEVFDQDAVTYERAWCLERKVDQPDLAWLLVYVLRPGVIHLGTPCTKMCEAGARQMDDTTHMLNEFSRKVALHQHAEGLSPQSRTRKEACGFTL